MTQRDELNNHYFEWLYKIVGGDVYSIGESYRMLLMELHRITFDPYCEMDEERAKDGEDLRYRFAYENSYDGDIIRTCLDYRPCSVLEMMVALAIRTEEHIMSDPDEGDRTRVWFWVMVENLRLTNSTDSNFNRGYVDRVIFNFLDHKYQRDGTGGLFSTSNPHIDMRSMDIWYQLNCYLNENTR